MFSQYKVTGVKMIYKSVPSVTTALGTTAGGPCAHLATHVGSNTVPDYVWPIAVTTP